MGVTPLDSVRSIFPPSAFQVPAMDSSFSSSILSVLKSFLHSTYRSEDAALLNILETLSKSLSISGKSFRSALENLSDEQVEGLKKRIGSKSLAQLVSLSRETNAELFYEALLQFGVRSLRGENFELGAVVVGGLAQNLFGQGGPLGVLRRAKEEWEGISAEGSFGSKLEFSLLRLAKEVIDPKTIVPMFLGTVAGMVSRDAILFRFADRAGVALAKFNPTRYQRFLVTSAALNMEVITYALSHLGIRSLVESGVKWDSAWVQDYWCTLNILGMRAGMGYLGKRWALGRYPKNIWTKEPQLTATQAWNVEAIRQISMVGGLFLALHANQNLGYLEVMDKRTQIRQATTMAIGLGIGQFFGQKLGARLIKPWHHPI